MRSAVRPGVCSMSLARTPRSYAGRWWSLYLARVSCSSLTAAATCRRRRRRVCRRQPVGRCQTMQALVNHHSQLETDTLPDWKPVKITQNWSDVVELPGSSNDARCCVLNSLQLCQQTIADSIQQTVAVIKSDADECMHQWFCCFQGQR